MVLSCVPLAHDSAHAWFTVPDQYEHIFGDELLVKAIDDFDMRQALAARAYFVLALDDVDSASLEDAPCFRRTAEIEIQDGLVVLERC